MSESTDPSGLRPEQFLEVLAKADASIVIVGGQAVNLWATLLLQDEEIENFGPLLSKDCDLLGTSQTVLDVARALGFRYLFAPHKIGTPVIGHVTGTTRDGHELLIEVLKSIHGVSPAEIAESVAIDMDGFRFRLLSPVTMLKAKIANAVDLPQKDRNDVRHAKIMVACVREFVRDLHDKAIKGTISERSLIKMLTDLRSITGSEAAVTLAGRHNVLAMQALPRFLADSPLPAVQNFVNHQMPWLRPDWLSNRSKPRSRKDVEPPNLT